MTRLDLAPRGIRRGNVENREREREKEKEKKTTSANKVRKERRSASRGTKGWVEKEGAEKENQRKGGKRERERERGEWRIHRINRQR